MHAQGHKQRKAFLGLRGQLDGVPLSFVLFLGENSVGANPDNDVVLAVPGVSRRHAVVSCEDGRVRVSDQGSKNGTFVNGVRVNNADLAPGDVVGFGPVFLELVKLSEAETVLLAEARAERSGQKLQGDASTAAQAQIPSRWLDAVKPWLASSLGHHQVGAALAALVDALQARGALVLEWLGPSAANVLHCAGAVPEPTVLSYLNQVVSLKATQSPSSEAVASMLVDDTNPPLAVAWCHARGSPKAVVVVGNFPARRAVGPILELVCRVFEATPETANPFPAPISLAREGNLIFPSGYLPGVSPAMKSVYHQLRHLVVGDIPVLICGETGVGKEPIAHILHLSSPRRSGPFVAVNCAAIPTELLEVELFGIEAGVATGVAKREGKFQLAQGGVILLDEISDMSPALQAKLLRVLQEKEVNPVGARRPVPVDVRVISATNANLLELVAQGRFRQDLYFRVAGFTLTVPPLRQRREDIPQLVLHFLERFTREVGKAVGGISAQALEMLVSAPWPGNVRQLENEVRRLAYLCFPNQPITAEMLSSSTAPGSAPSAGNGTAEDLHLERQTEELERKLILTALQRSGGKVAKAAGLLGLSRQGLRLKMRRFGLGEVG